MKKKTIAMFLLVCMVLSMTPAMGPSASAEEPCEPEATEAAVEEAESPAEETAMEEAVMEETEPSTVVLGAEQESSVGGVNDLEDVFKAEVYVKANPEAGLAADIKVDFGELSCYGTLYLPGCVDASQLRFSWDDPELKFSQGEVEYESGSAPVALDGECVSYTVSKGMVYEVMTIKTMIGSEYVSPMFLELDESLGTIDAMNSDADHETSCYGSVTFDGQVYPYMSMKGRGNSTWSQDKKPYNLTFYKKADYDKKQKVELIDGVESKKWSLLANYIDTSLMRNKIAMDLASKLGIGLESRFVDLYMNGEYLGSYLLCPKNDYQAPDGGYMLENDNYLSTDDPQFQLDGMEELNIRDGFYNRMTIKSIGDDAVEAGETAETIEAWFATAWEALTDYDSTEYTKYFDVDSWAKMYLMYEMCKNYDVFSGSVLMYREGLTDEDLMIAGPAWDYDTCLGRTVYKLLSGVTLPTQITAEGWYLDSVGLTADDGPLCLLQEFGKHPDFVRRMSEIFNEYRWAFDEIVEDIDAQQTILEKSALMDNELWGIHHLNVYIMPTDSVIGSGQYALNYKTTDSWYDLVSNMREYVEKRLLWLSDHMYTQAPTGQIVGNTELMAYDTLELTAEVTSGTNENTYQWQSSKKGKNWDNIEGATAQTLTLQVTEKQDGMQYRCVVSNSGPTIYMMRTDAVKAAACTALDSVKISVTAHTHSYTETVVAPTCTEAGYTLHICSCGDSYTSDEQEALDHSYVDGFCQRCGEKNPVVTTEIRREKTELTEGKLIMTLDGKEAGEYTFTKTDDGWYIQDQDGNYLTVNRSKLQLSDKPFAWSFSGHVFSAETQVSLTTLGKRWGINHKATAYLRQSSGSLTVSLICGSWASFEKDVEYVV